MTERIHFQIDDSELVKVTTKIDKSTERVKVLGRRSRSLTMDLESLEERAMSGFDDLQALSIDTDETMGRLVQVDLFGNRIKADVDTVGKSTRLLESRVKQLMRRIPIGREAIRIQRKFAALGTTIEGAEGLEGAAAAGISAVLLLVVVMNVLKRLDRIQKQMIRDMQGFENEVRTGLDLTFAEFAELDRDVIGFATQWEAFTTRWEDAVTTEESWNAIADFVVAKIGAFPEFRGAAAGFGPMPLEPQWITDLKNWYDNIPKDDSGYPYVPNLGGGLVE